MPLRLLSFATYLTRNAVQWRQPDYNAYKFVRAIKGRPINGYAWIPSPSGSKRLTDTNKDSAIGWFAEMAAPHVEQARRVGRRTLLVPVPSSSCVEGSEPSRTYQLAQEIADRVPGVVVADVLRWREENVPSSQGGPRDPQVLYDNLVVTRRPSIGAACDCIVVDDVVTSKGHVHAAAARLRAQGATVRLAISAGRTVHEPPEDPFAVNTEDLDDFDPIDF